MAEQTLCPYCRMAFDQQSPAKVYCTACGMPHHEDCYQENGGCTVFGCPKAPADDPKLQVSYGDLSASATFAQTAAASAYASPSQGAAAQMAYAPQPIFSYAVPPKSRTAFILLGVFLGAFGAHNFYAGYTGKAVGQLCLSILTIGYLAIASWIWAIIEVCIIDKDSTGRPFI